MINSSGEVDPLAANSENGMNWRPYSLVDVRWLPLPDSLAYPTRTAFGTTGFREVVGIGGIFSVYVVVESGTAGPGLEQPAELYALVGGMSDRLPEIGSRFFLTTGTTTLAECTTVGRGDGDPAGS